MKKITFNMRKRILSLALALVSLLALFPSNIVSAAENYDGGIAYANVALTVYSDSSCSTSKGTIYQHEGFTVLNTSGLVSYVEYSTSSGAKRGYVKNTNSSINYRTSNTCVAMITNSSTVYYGTDTSSYSAAGSVYAGELVVVLAKNDDWVYIEYNTTSGRKRGYMSYSNLSCYNRPAYFDDLYTYSGLGSDEYVSGTHYVRSGPTEQYPIIGTVSDEYVRYIHLTAVEDSTENWYIEYTVTGTNTKKSGFLF